MSDAPGGAPPARLLVLRALGLGDLLTAVPALRALGRRFPAHQRLLATTAAVAPLMALVDPGYEVVPVAPLGPLPAAVDGVDVAVNLHGKGPQSHRVLLARRPAQLIAYAHADVAASAAGPAWDDDEHEVRRWCRLLEASGIDADPADLDLAVPAHHMGPTVDGATVIHPGAASAARRWPVERWAAVARHERAAGRGVVVTGGPDERVLAGSVADAAGLPTSCVLAGRTDALGLAAVVAAAGRVVCGDTGVAHLATALRTPSVVLFGPVSPARWGPPADRPRHVALWAGRQGDPHAGTVDPGLLEITVADVLAALDALASLSRRR